jgi:branched-chain amino acid aminotransferase
MLSVGRCITFLLHPSAFCIHPSSLILHPSSFRLSVLAFPSEFLILRRMDTYSANDFPRLAERLRKPFTKHYYAMYSSVYGGIVTDPALMMLPIDDHMVHRGDGLFETFKCVNGSIYNLEGHLARLAHGEEALFFTLPMSKQELIEIVVQTIRVGGHRDCAVRLFLSRGPGSFDVNPYDCPERQVYVVVYHLKPPFMQRHPAGAVVATSAIPAKPPLYATIKNCNYLPNMLMRKEAADRNMHFVMSYDSKGHLAEGATENMGVVTHARELLFPHIEGILAGTTMVRVMELAEGLVKSGEITRVGFADLPLDAVRSAAELLVVGTTLDVVAVTRYDDRPVGNGKPGPIHARLSALLTDDIHSNRALLTPVFD